MKRPSWDEYFMNMLDVVKSRSTCTRRQVSASIVKDNHILSSGYNGTPKDIIHCDIKGCLREQLNVKSGERHELCRGLHAEQNAIIQASYIGVSIKDSTLYCTNKPCSICAKMICNAGIVKVVYEEDYDDTLSDELFKEKGIELIKYKR